MNRKIIYICLLFAFVEMQAQNIRGVWFAGYNLKIDKYAGVDEFQVDSTYSIEGSIIDFSSPNKFHIKSVGGELNTGNYTQKGDSLFLELDEFKWKAVLQNQRLKLTMIDSTDYSLELFYDKLKPSNISSKSLLKSEQLLSSSWNIVAKNREIGLTFLPKDTLNVLNKERAIVTCASEVNTGTSLGYYQIDSYKNYSFLYLLDGSEFEEKMLCLHYYSNGLYEGVLFEVGIINDEILYQTANFSALKFINEPELTALKLQLKGRYQLKLMNLNESGVSQSAKTIISYLELLDHNVVKLDEFITENIKGTDALRKTQKEGTWELSTSGKFITLKFEDSEDCYLTIRKENNKTILYMSGNPFPEEEKLEIELKFKKQ